MLPAELAGKYELRGTLGAGAMGTVFDAFDRMIERRVAVKVVKLPGGGDAEAIEAHARFRREAQAVSRIRSPWVVSVVDFGTSDSGLTYLVMEHCAGSPLDQIMAADKVLEPARAARFTSQIASGLAVAHKVGLIHRDVKPANVMIEDNEGKEFAKLLDFGIVRVPELDASDKLTVEGAVMGTPPYMSPEQASGQEVTPQSDLYSLGVVLYQMLSSRKPFTGSAREIFHKHNHEPPPPLAMSGPLVDLCYALLAKSPAQRPASAAVVAELAKRIEVELRGGEASLDPFGNATAAIPRGASALVSSPGTPSQGTPGLGTPAPGVPRVPGPGARGRGRRAPAVSTGRRRPSGTPPPRPPSALKR
jgi:serine/threonine-protein kinase